MTNATGRELFHKQNLDLVLQQIFNNKIISRIDISRTLNLNKSTVSALYNELDEKGILKEVGSGESTSAGGRKPVLVKINEHYGYTINFDLGFRHLHVMGNYINGEVFYYQRIELGSRDIHKILEMIDQQIKISKQSDKTKHGLLGIGFSIHGIVQDNQIVNSPFIDMDGVDLADRYSKKYHVPVILENEANLSGIYERDFNDGKDKDNIIAISIHKGIGAGIILNKQLYRGFNGEAGEIGRSLMFTENFMDNKNDKVEDFCSEDAIIDQVEAQTKHEHLTREDLVQMNQAGDQIVQKELVHFTYAISRVIYNVAISFAPEELYLNSPLIEAIPSLFDEVVANTSKLGMKIPIRLIVHSGYATLLGCCSVVTHRVLDMDDYNLEFAIQE
ncbi:ROK family transcriptional regulator [Lentilactobacillus fungorum]|uniref:ROK family transcriptional regulator n=1 Tax=Lentilactobacillus fungorum TaxID=2201250 RepID=A0ABQ3W173_9LACO|nr:ROK family protein [Lentilactobacillus fungorum]GHP14930.1 ROK family transcriptional regulator [Lentilactobacillus fungorum]